LIGFRKEKKFKLQEAELREKDILIQDNLIKFSTFLQQQEMRKKKEMDQTENELKVSNNFNANLSRKLSHLKGILKRKSIYSQFTRRKQKKLRKRSKV